MPGRLEMARARPPAADTIHRSGVPRRYEVKAICAPSGEYAGIRHSEPMLVSTLHVGAVGPDGGDLALPPGQGEGDARAERRPRMPVNCSMTSLTQSSTSGRSAGAPVGLGQHRRLAPADLVEAPLDGDAAALRG